MSCCGGSWGRKLGAFSIREGANSYRRSEGANIRTLELMVFRRSWDGWRCVEAPLCGFGQIVYLGLAFFMVVRMGFRRLGTVSLWQLMLLSLSRCCRNKAGFGPFCWCVLGCLSALEGSCVDRVEGLGLDRCKANAVIFLIFGGFLLKIWSRVFSWTWVKIKLRAHHLFSGAVALGLGEFDAVLSNLHS